MIAQRLADKLRKDSEMERQRMQHESELLALRLQEQVIREKKKHHNGVQNEIPVPPRQPKQQVSSANMMQHSPPGEWLAHQNGLPLPPTMQQLPSQVSASHSHHQQPALNYISLDLSSQRSNIPYKPPNPTPYTQIAMGGFDIPPPNELTPQKKSKINLQSHTPEKNLQAQHSVNHHKVTNDLDFDDDRRYEEMNYNSNFQKLSPEKFDYLVGNIKNETGALKKTASRNILNNGSVTSSLEPTPCHSRENSSNGQDRIKTLMELGLPPEEIREIDRRLEQEIRDEELARKLQQQESVVDMSQEEKDRLLAMEAQDKELARMLQERVNIIYKFFLIKYYHYI